MCRWCTTMCNTCTQVFLYDDIHALSNLFTFLTSANFKLEMEFCHERLDDLIQKFVRLEELAYGPEGRRTKRSRNSNNFQQKLQPPKRIRDSFLKRSFGILGKSLRTRGTNEYQKSLMAPPTFTSTSMANSCCGCSGNI